MDHFLHFLEFYVSKKSNAILFTYTLNSCVSNHSCVEIYTIIQNFGFPLPKNLQKLPIKSSQNLHFEITFKFTFQLKINIST
jgi:hypothetical protein